MMVLYVPVYGQRSFITMVGQQQRSYTISHVNAPDDTYNLPLLIIAFNDETKTLPATGFNGPGMIVAVPKISPDCSDLSALKNDITFLTTIIRETYENFRIDRNRVYIISSSTTACLADSLMHYKENLITKTVRLRATETLTEAITRAVQLTDQPVEEPKYALWRNPLYDAEQEQKRKEDSIRLHRWDKRISVEFRMGRFDMLGAVKTEEDGTYMDVTDAHSMMSLYVNRWMNDSMAWFVDISRLKIPQLQEFNGARIEMGGGMVLSLTYGLKYTFYRHKLRPYMLLGTGPLSFMVFGGRFTQNVDPQQIRSVIESEVRMALQTKIGTGIEGRLGKRISIGAHALYIHSSEFKSAGSVRAIRGFYNSLSVGYILGANKDR